MIKMINAIAEFIVVNLAWIFWIMVIELPDTTPDWICALIAMIAVTLSATSFILMVEEL